MSATSPPSPLHGATAIVTGAAVGLGAAFARALGEAGTHLVLCDVRLELAASVAELDDLGVAVVGVPGDVSLPQDVQRVVEAARARFGGVDVLVNNAAVFRASPPTGPWAKGLDDFEAVVGVNLRGPSCSGGR
ncbi:MAG: SDR family oxidoreductase [Acidimicrobiia bacterium]|nr:SDR family oxidoreductase [Acidimicrobiia bacterium]